MSVGTNQSPEHPRAPRTVRWRSDSCPIGVDFDAAGTHGREEGTNPIVSPRSGTQRTPYTVREVSDSLPSNDGYRHPYPSIEAPDRGIGELGVGSVQGNEGGQVLRSPGLGEEESGGVYPPPGGMSAEVPCGSGETRISGVLAIQGEGIRQILSTVRTPVHGGYHVQLPLIHALPGIAKQQPRTVRSPYSGSEDAQTRRGTRRLPILDSGVQGCSTPCSNVGDSVERNLTIHEISFKIRQLRTKLEMSQKVFAEYVGVSTYVIAELEVSQYPKASLTKLRKLARFIEVPVELLNPTAREISKGQKGGRWPRPGQTSVHAEEIDAEIAMYDRPQVRGDCLTSRGRFVLAHHMAMENRMPLPEADENGGDGQPDGMNCQRPCPYVTCKYNLFTDVNSRSGGMKLNFPSIEVSDLSPFGVEDLLELSEEEVTLQETESPGSTFPSCALDVADVGGITLERVGVYLNVTRERARQLEDSALDKARLAVSQSGIGQTVELASVAKVQTTLDSEFVFQVETHDDMALEERSFLDFDTRV